jgi:hypothetical protein
MSAGQSRDAALALHTLGINVVRAARGRKCPAGSWKRWQSERVTRRDVEDAFANGHGDDNVFACTGAISQLVVLDCDDEVALEHWRGRLGDALDRTAAVHTANGMHFWFRLPAGVVLASRKSDGRDGTGKWDLQAEGKGVIAPPSTHPSGHTYRWEHERGPEVALEAPAALLEAVPEASPGPRGSLNGRGGGDPRPWEPLDREGVFRGTPAGGRDDAAYRYACSLRSRGISETEGRALMRAAWESMEQPSGDEYPLTTALEKVGRAYREFPQGRSLEFGGADTAGSWDPLDLSDVVRGIEAGEVVGPVPTCMLRSDGVALLYPGEVHSLAGEPESGKGWLMLSVTADLLRAGERVLYLDFEDSPASIVGRLLALGADAATIITRLAYVRPEGGLSRSALDALLARGPFALAVADGLSEAYALLGLDSYANQDVPKFLARLARPLAATGAAVVLIDHVPKDRENRGRYAIGAQHKLAGVAAAYGVQVIERPSRTQTGRIKLVLAKDRHGHVPGRTGSEIALVTVDPSDGGSRVEVRVDPPDGTDPEGKFRPTALMERVSIEVEGEPGLSLKQLRARVRGKDQYVSDAIEVLLAEGWIRREKVGSAFRHYSVRAFRADRAPVADRGPSVASHAAATVARPASPKGRGHGEPPHSPTNRGPHAEPQQQLPTGGGD